MLFSQSQVWKKYESHKLEDFLHSSEAKEWLKSAMALGRKPLFEFDRSYYPSKSAALNHSQRVRDLLREQPLLRYADLKELKIKNAQKIIEGFSALPYLRTEKLKLIRASFAEK